MIYTRNRTYSVTVLLQVFVCNIKDKKVVNDEYKRIEGNWRREKKNCV